MCIFATRKQVNALRKQFPEGTRVELLHMEDAQAPPIGTRGTVRSVDDIGTIFVSWDNGSKLGVAYGDDEIAKVEEVQFDEKYVNEECGTITLYFIAPKSWLKRYTTQEYPDAVSMEICIEFPSDHIEANYAITSISPTKKEDDAYIDYDWTYVLFSREEVEHLIAIANNVITNQNNKRSVE